MPELELGPVWLSLQLATITVLVLLVVATPLAWWLAFTHSRARTIIEAVVAMPLVLPPTVLGFYMLILLGPAGWVGGAWLSVTDTTLTFSFTGLVVASVIYSFPFTVQPLQAAFEGVGRSPLEAAATLGASPLDRFWHVASPLALRGYVSAVVLTFAHTLGEFGVVLMVGGNIPAETRTLSIAIYDRMQAFDDRSAGVMAATLLVIAVATLTATTALSRRVGPRRA
jgi:molybdate transport system permease protein